jgi:histidinol-phosphate aminotransferase
MTVSRRSLLRRLGASAIVGTAAESLGSLSFAKIPKSLWSLDRNSRVGPIFLDHNENAYGPSEKVLAALRDATSMSNRYARMEYDSLVSEIAALHSVRAEQIVVTYGSSQILQLAAVEFLGSGKKLVQAAPTFPLLGRIAHNNGMEVVEVPLTKTMEHDLNGMLSQAGDSAGLIYICNPNNPTGTLTPRKNIEAFIETLPPKTMVLIDEAYHHYVQPTSRYASFVDQPLSDARVIVSRTFSKIYGLAGMRVGYAVASPEVARRFSAHQPNLAMSVVALKGAIAAAKDTEYVQLAFKRNADDQQEFMNQVNARMVHALDSHTNFVMMNPLRDASKVTEHLKSNGILIAPSFPSMPKYVRVSLGTPREMGEFWRVLDQLRVTEKMHM